MPLSDGTAGRVGFCSPAPMGTLCGSDKMPSVKFAFPRFGDVVSANSPFNITLNIFNMVPNRLTATAAKFLAAPQELDSEGRVLGHAQVVVEAIDSMNQTTPLNPSRFVFARTIIDVGTDGILRGSVDALAPGFYRMAGFLQSANHQPILTAVNQKGAMNDVVYVRVHFPHCVSHL